MRLPAPHRRERFRELGLERANRARPDDLIELSASTYNDQLQRFKVLDSDMPYLFRRGERADRQLQDWGIAAAGGLSLIMRVESRDLTQE